MPSIEMPKYLTLSRIFSDPLYDGDPRASYLTPEDQRAKGEIVGVAVRTDLIRSFNPRRNGKPGTRIDFQGGGGFPVQETPDQVARMLGIDQVPMGQTQGSA